MRSTLWLGFGAAIILSLALMGMAQVTQGETDDSRQILQEFLAFLSPCGPSTPEQPIPDDGRWLQICLLDPMAPEASTATTVHLKYWIEHSDPSQLEVYLSRDSNNPRQPLWEQGKLVAGTEFGKAANLTSFEGSPSQGPWYLWIRDVVPGEQGVFKDVSLVIDYRPPSPCRSR